MPEQSIFTMMPKPWNGMARHWMRRENTPMRTSSASSSVKSSRMGRAKIPTMSATAEMPATHAIMENRNDSRTRSNRFAPHEKPATGWKPWPKPRQALVINMVMRFATLIAASALVP